jgi:hypothetical protein
MIMRTLLIILALSAFGLSKTYSQCITKDDVKIKVEKNQIEIDLSSYFGNLDSYRLRLYNLETEEDYVDTQVNIAQISKYQFNENLNLVKIINVPSGDYLIIFENSGCDKLFIGKGFSGFPFSGLSIE